MTERLVLAIAVGLFLVGLGAITIAAILGSLP